MKHLAASRSRSCRGEMANGDRAVVRVLDDGVLLAVIDGLGHGPAAERAAVLAAEVLATEELTTEGHADHARDVLALLDATHRVLRGTRGAAATIAIARGERLSIAGVGNVAAWVFGEAKLAPRLAPGIVGHTMPRTVRPLEATLTGATRLVIASDGVSTRITREELAGLAPDAACAWLIERFSVAHDDATALVADLTPHRSP